MTPAGTTSGSGALLLLSRSADNAKLWFAVAGLLAAVRRLGIEMRLWVVSYSLYLLAVFFPQSSTFRLLMPMFPLLGAVAQPRSRVYRVAVVAASLALQWGWLLVCWRVDGYDWTPP